MDITEQFLRKTASGNKCTFGIFINALPSAEQEAMNEAIQLVLANRAKYGMSVNKGYTATWIRYAIRDEYDLHIGALTIQRHIRKECRCE